MVTRLEVLIRPIPAVFHAAPAGPALSLVEAIAKQWKGCKAFNVVVRNVRNIIGAGAKWQLASWPPAKQTHLPHPDSYPMGNKDLQLSCGLVRAGCGTFLACTK